MVIDMQGNSLWPCSTSSSTSQRFQDFVFLFSIFLGASQTIPHPEPHSIPITLIAELLAVEMRSLCPLSALQWDKPSIVLSCVWEFSRGHKASPPMLTIFIFTLVLSPLIHWCEVWTWLAMTDENCKERYIKWDLTSVLVVEQPEPFLVASKTHEWGTPSCVEVGVLDSESALLLTSCERSNEDFLSFSFFI